MTNGSTRERLLAVGVEQFLKSGYAATGVKEILAAAGVPKGSFYHYFPSKEAFANEVINCYFNQEAALIESVFGDAAVRPLKRLRTYFERLAERYETGGPVGGCLFGNMSQEVADHSVALQSLLRNKFHAWQGALADMVRQAKAQGELPKTTKPDEIAAFLLNGWQGALVRMKAEKSTAPLHEFLKIAFQHVVR